MVWQLQDAKQKFSQVVRRAREEGPQTVTYRGEDAVVVLSVEEYRRLRGATPDFKTFLLTGPDLTDLDLDRPGDIPRDIEL